MPNKGKDSGSRCTGIQIHFIAIVVVNPRTATQTFDSLNKAPPRRMFDLNISKDTNKVLWVTASLVGILAYLPPYFFLPCSFCLHKSNTHNS